MIIINLHGGLGNQMFQYAFGRYISCTYNRPLYFSVDFLSSIESRKHDTLLISKIFDVSLNILSNSNLYDYLGFRSSKIFRKIYGKYLSQYFDMKNFLFESKFGLCEVLPAKLPFHYYQGYWQSERYFHSISNVIKSDFKFCNIKFDLRLNKLLDDLKNRPSVAVHIRCGDYVNNSYHGLLGVEYYHSAFNLILEKEHRPKFFIFTDNISYSRNLLRNFNFEIEILDYMNNYPDHYSMYFMTLSKHNIIANSTFSWWSCWLNSGKNGFKIAPKQWFHLKAPPLDLIPADWIVL